MRRYYWTVCVSFEEDAAKRTEWHPDDRVGPFSVLTRGAFPTAMEGYRWARAKLGASTCWRLRLIDTLNAVAVVSEIRSVR